MSWLLWRILKTIMAVLVVLYWFHWSGGTQLIKLWENAFPEFERAIQHG